MTRSHLANCCYKLLHVLPSVKKTYFLFLHTVGRKYKILNFVIWWFLQKYFYVEELFIMPFPNICADTSRTQNCLCRNYPWPVMVCNSVLIICCFFLIIHELDCKLRHSITVDKGWQTVSLHNHGSLRDEHSVLNPLQPNVCLCIYAHWWIFSPLFQHYQLLPHAWRDTLFMFRKQVILCIWNCSYVLEISFQQSFRTLQLASLDGKLALALLL